MKRKVQSAVQSIQDIENALGEYYKNMSQYVLKDYAGLIHRIIIKATEEPMTGSFGKMVLFKEITALILDPYNEWHIKNIIDDDTHIIVGEIPKGSFKDTILFKDINMLESDPYNDHLSKVIINSKHFIAGEIPTGNFATTAFHYNGNAISGNVTDLHKIIITDIHEIEDSEE